MAQYYQRLTEMRHELPVHLQAKLTNDYVMEICLSLQDGTVFDIVKELEEIQQLNERSLLNRRMKIVGSHKKQRMDMTQRHKEELRECRPHNLSLVKTRHEKEWTDLDTRLNEEIHSTDQKIILELDQLVSDQQSTLQQAAVPFFVVSNDTSDIQLQSYLLQFILRLSTD